MLRSWILRRMMLIAFVYALGLGAIIWVSAPLIDRQSLSHIESQLEVATQIAQSIVTDFQHKARDGDMTEEEAQEAALEQLSVLRYNRDHSFFVIDMDGVYLMHPWTPQMTGRSALNTLGATGAPIMADKIALVEEKGGGFYLFSWGRHPDEDPRERIASVFGVDDWGWVIATSGFLPRTTDALEPAITALIRVSAAILVALVLATALVLRDRSKPSPARAPWGLARVRTESHDTSSATHSDP